MTSSSSKFQ
jgi:hypothetical protein